MLISLRICPKSSTHIVKKRVLNCVSGVKNGFGGRRRAAGDLPLSKSGGIRRHSAITSASISKNGSAVISRKNRSHQKSMQIRYQRKQR